MNGGAINFVDPVITLIVRAYDLGIPSLSSEVPVQIFTTDVSSRTMKFIVNKDPETVGKRHSEMRLEIWPFPKYLIYIYLLKIYFAVCVLH